MRELKHILVCIDLSEYSVATMDYGMAMARGMGMDILALNVINKRDVDAARSIAIDFPERINIDEYVERTRKHRLKRIQELVDSHFPEDQERVRLQVTMGVPFEAILEAIEKENIDIVVIGNKGRSNIAGTLFGSNAEKVFRHSKVPVLSVRSGDNFSR